MANRKLEGGLLVGSNRKIDGEYAYGTIGTIVWYNKRPMILSAFHVLSPDGRFVLNDEIGQPPGRTVAQMSVGSFGNGQLDVGLAEVCSDHVSMIGNNGTSRVYGIPPQYTQPSGFATQSDINKLIKKEIPVIKSGYSTKLTEGFIVGIRKEAFTINYPIARRKFKVYNLIVIQAKKREFSKEMDSGSIIMTPGETLPDCEYIVAIFYLEVAVSLRS